MIESHSKPLTQGLLVVIDGPAGAGKTSLARKVADHFSVPFLDTGAIYRAVAWEAKRQNIGWDDEPALAAIAESLPIRFVKEESGQQRVMLHGEDVTTAIREPEIAEGASRVSVFPLVRGALLRIQRYLSEDGCIAEGRDMGTVVFPDARHKFFLTASTEARARRRHREMQSMARLDPMPSLEQVMREIVERDTRDTNRSTAPLSQAKDAILIDSSQLDQDQVAFQVIQYIEKQMQENA